MERDIKKIVSEMTLEEKAGMCSGIDNWHTKAIERLNVPSIMMTDGPHGMRKEAGNGKTVQATCFPTGSCLASSWDKELMKSVGKAIGEECQSEGVSIILGPAVNIKRSPLCGRNFEYYSEDPYLSSRLAASYIEGVQSQGVGTSIKHFAANNQEYYRFVVDTKADERTLRELYLSSFEYAIKKAKPWTVMCSYNKLNGFYNSENKWLLTDVLRDEWGFDGFVMSDWGAVNNRDDGVLAGLDLEMPSSGGVNQKVIVDAVKSGKIPEKVLDKVVYRLLKIIFKAYDNKKKNAVYSKTEHHELAKKAAEDCMVLLKNEDNILPLKKSGHIAIIGEFAKRPRFEGGGSSHVNPLNVENTYDDIKKSVGENADLTYSKGYSIDSDEVDEKLINEAVKNAENADVAVVFAGLTEKYESEGYDRVDMAIPESHVKLIEAVAKVQKNTVVVLSNGSPVEMPWINDVKGILDCYLAGEAMGSAISDILFGDVNPSGKLAETFPEKLSHNPSYLNFPGKEHVEYNEGIFVGYRYYDKKEIAPLFPFGFGLSYTNFEYTGISVDKKEMDANDTVTVNVKVKNIGKVTGKEVVELYVRDVKSGISRPQKELKGFEKVELQPGEEKTVSFKLGMRAFAYYDEEIKDWNVESGELEILAGSSSRDIKLKETVNVKSSKVINKKYTKNSTIEDIMESPKGAAVINEMLKSFEQKTEQKVPYFEMIKSIPISRLVLFTHGLLTMDTINAVIDKINN